MSAPELHLASTSPRRKEILRAMGLAYSTAGVDVVEQREEGETAAEMVLRLAEEKVRAARVDPSCVVVAADTAVVLGDEVFGKPRDEADALDMLSRLSGRTHVVMTGVAVRSPDGVHTALSKTDVRFREIGPDEALAYWQSGEPRDKAGAYAIQGRGGIFVAAISGSYSGVVGLPVFETAELLQKAGLRVLSK